MGQERESDFYNKGQLINWEKWERNPHESGYIRKAADYLPPPNRCPTIVELGCSFGLFAFEVKKRGYKNYLGIDFAPDLIAKAKEMIPEYQFMLADLRDDETYKLLKEYRVFVVLETLEHIKKDLGLLQAIPSGSLVIISIPSNDSEAHVRYFPEMIDVFVRYNNFLRFWEVIQLESNGIFVCKATRR